MRQGKKRTGGRSGERAEDEIEAEVDADGTEIPGAYEAFRVKDGIEWAGEQHFQCRVCAGE